MTWVGGKTSPGPRVVQHRFMLGAVVLRYFASDVCEQGELKNIDQAQVDRTAKKVIRELRRNDIGHYFQEGIWDTLWNPERAVLKRVQSEAGLTEDAIPRELEGAVANLENFGLLVLDNGQFRLTSALFGHWLARQYGVAYEDTICEIILSTRCCRFIMG